MLEDPVRALLEAPDSQSLNRVRLLFQRTATPEQLHAARALAPDLPQEARRWLRRLSDYAFWEKADPEPFRATVIDDSMTMFDVGGTPTEDRELVIGVAGVMGNLFLPAPAVLQQFDATRQHLLLLRDESREAYRAGAGPHMSFEALFDAVRAIAARYRSSITIGASMGGGPAVIMGLALGSRRAVSLGGGFSERSPQAPALATPDGCRGASSTEILCLHGSEHEKDRSRAKTIVDRYPQAHRVAILGYEKHNIADEAFRAGAMSALFRLVLADEPLTGSRSASDPLSNTSSNRCIEVDLVPTMDPPRWAQRRSETSRSIRDWRLWSRRSWVRRRRHET